MKKNSGQIIRRVLRLIVLISTIILVIMMIISRIKGDNVDFNQILLWLILIKMDLYDAKWELTE